LQLQTRNSGIFQCKWSFTQKSTRLPGLGEPAGPVYPSLGSGRSYLERWKGQS